MTLHDQSLDELVAQLEREDHSLRVQIALALGAALSLGLLALVSQLLG